MVTAILKSDIFVRSMDTLGRFSPYPPRETTCVTPCLPLLHTKSLLKMINSKRNIFSHKKRILSFKSRPFFRREIK